MEIQQLKTGGSEPDAWYAARFPQNETKQEETLQGKTSPHASPADITPKSTLLLRNIPLSYTRDTLMDLLLSEGFAYNVEFMYVPVNFRKGVNFGYAIVDMTTMQKAEQCKEKLTGFSSWKDPSDKVMDVEWSKVQGLDANIELCRNSPNMHSSVRDDWKPAIYKHLVRLELPAPTRTVKAPRHVGVISAQGTSRSSTPPAAQDSSLRHGFQSQVMHQANFRTRGYGFQADNAAEVGVVVEKKKKEKKVKGTKAVKRKDSVESTSIGSTPTVHRAVQPKQQSLRLQVDFENHRRLAEDEKNNLESRAKHMIVGDILEVLDRFKQTKQFVQPETKGEEKIHEAYESVYKQVVDIFGSLSTTESLKRH
jgi:molecular chaperone GrpE (heat shock protein)